MLTKKDHVSHTEHGLTVYRNRSRSLSRKEEVVVEVSSETVASFSSILSGFMTNCMDFTEIVHGILTGMREQMHACVSDDSIDFLAEFYTEAIASVLVNRFSCPSKYSEKQLVEYLSSVFYRGIPALFQ